MLIRYQHSIITSQVCKYSVKSPEIYRLLCLKEM